MAAGSRMQACTQQWLDRPGHDRAGYPSFLRTCLKTPEAVAARPQPKPRHRKAVVGSVRRKAPAERRAGPKPNRMKACGAQWHEMKAAGGVAVSWRQFVRTCLKRP